MLHVDDKPLADAHEDAGIVANLLICSARASSILLRFMQTVVRRLLIVTIWVKLPSASK